MHSGKKEKKKTSSKQQKTSQQHHVLWGQHMSAPSAGQLCWWSGQMGQECNADKLFSGGGGRGSLNL